MNDAKTWLEETSLRARALSEAYRITLRRFRLFNLFFQVLPAVLTTAAAVFGALDKVVFLGIPFASGLAGIAAILITVHKTLKCEDYQAECLRLSQAYQSIAIAAEAASLRPDDEPSVRMKSLESELVELTMNAKVQVASNFMGSSPASLTPPQTKGEL